MPQTGYYGVPRIPFNQYYQTPSVPMPVYSGNEVNQSAATDQQQPVSTVDSNGLVQTFICRIPHQQYSMVIVILSFEVYPADLILISGSVPVSIGIACSLFCYAELSALCSGNFEIIFPCLNLTVVNLNCDAIRLRLFP